LVEIEVTVDAFNGKITDDLTVKAKKGDKLQVSKEAWDVIQKNHKKWFKLIQEVKEVVEVPHNKMISSKYKNK
jgi:hypothetical protein